MFDINFYRLHNRGLANRDAEDYGTLASAKVRVKVKFDHFCNSRACSDENNPWKKVLKFTSEKIKDNCPDCGHVLLTKVAKNEQ